MYCTLSVVNVPKRYAAQNGRSGRGQVFAFCLGVLSCALRLHDLAQVGFKIRLIKRGLTGRGLKRLV